MNKIEKLRKEREILLKKLYGLNIRIHREIEKNEVLPKL